MSDSYIAIIKQLSGYDQTLNKLKCEYGNQSKILERWHCTFGLQPKGFVKRVNQLYADKERENAQLNTKKRAAARLLRQQAKQLYQATVRQAWPENFELLQQEIPEWHELSEMFLEHKFGDSARSQKRIAVLSQLNVNNNLDAGTNKNNSLAASNSNDFITQNYNLSPQINLILRDTGLSAKTYKTCYGNPFQQLIHQENLDQLQQLGTLSPLSPIFYHKLAITECVDAAREYNQAGLVHDGVQVTDMCWAIIDYGKAIGEGAIQGLIMVAKDLIDNPEQALLLVVAGEYVLAYQVAKVTYEVAKIGLTAWQDPTKGQEEWDNYIAPVTELVNAFENNEITARDALKTGTMVAVGCRAQGKLSSGLGKLCKVTKANALTYLKNNPHATPQLYMSTPDGKILKATSEIKKLSNRERKLEQIKHAKQAVQPITEFLTELSDEAFKEAMRYAKIDNNFKHYFEKKHKFMKLIIELGGEDEVLIAVLKACVGKIPAVGVFDEIPVNVSEFTVHISGRVIDGVPKLGTMFIK